MTTAKLTTNTIATRPRTAGASFLSQVLLLTRRNLVNIVRTPEALIPPIAISVFFLVDLPVDAG